jgi:thiol-disulfide isomerase/thioredoxin
MLTTAACSGEAGPQPEGEPIAFTGKLLDGEYIALDDYRGKVVLVNVWATWCKPCKKELPELARLHREYEARGFLVLGVNVDSDALDGAVRAMVHNYDLPYPIVRDTGMASSPAFKVDGYPTSVLLDREGRRVWRRLGEIRPEDPELVQAIESQLAKPQTPDR